MNEIMIKTYYLVGVALKGYCCRIYYPVGVTMNGIML